jgi:N-acetylmuramoyl-L-alanine amidase
LTTARLQRINVNLYYSGIDMRKIWNSVLIASLAIVMTGCSSKYQSEGYYEEEPFPPTDTFVPPSQNATVAFAKRAESAPRRYEPIIEKPLLIIIDPGHGGDDFGTTSPFKKNFHEKYANLATAQMLQTYLQQMGFRTLMTRQNDFFVSLPARSQFANQQNGDLYVSVHYNSAPAESAHGVEVFYYNSTENKERTAKSKELARDVLAKVIALTGAKSRGVKHGNLAVIRETKMPAVLIEGGFFTNQDEFNLLKDPNYVRKIARGIAQGVKEYVQKK